MAWVTLKDDVERERDGQRDFALVQFGA